MTGDFDAKLFEQYTAWAKEERAITDPHEKLALEYSKASVEFSKLLVTNLHLINAGGLLASPSISNFLGFASAPRHEKIWLIGVPSSLFIAGLLFAAACALATYWNYQLHGFRVRATAEKEVMEAEKFFPSLKTDARTEVVEREFPQLLTQISRLERRIQRMFRLAHVFGWCSIACFVTACVFLASNIR